MRRWWRRRRPDRGRHVLDAPYRRVPDGDSVPVDGYPERWQARINRAMREPTRDLPTVPAPLVRPYVNQDHVGHHRWPA